MFSSYRRAARHKVLINHMYRSVRCQHSGTSAKGSALGSVVKLAAGSVAICGSAVGAAWYEPRLRSSMEQTVPPIKHLFSAVLGPLDQPMTMPNDTSQSIESQGLAKPTIIRQKQPPDTPQGGKQAPNDSETSKTTGGEPNQIDASVNTTPTATDVQEPSSQPVEPNISEVLEQNQSQKPLESRASLNTGSTVDAQASSDTQKTNEQLLEETQAPSEAVASHQEQGDKAITEELATTVTETEDASQGERAAQSAAYRHVLREVGEEAATTLTDSLSRIEEAITCTQAYCHALKQALSEELQSVEPWQLAEQARKSHPEVMKRAQEAVDDAQQRVAKLACVVDEGKRDQLTASSAMLNRAEESLNDMEKALADAVGLLKNSEESLSVVTDVLQKNAEEARQCLLTELNAIAPSVAEKATSTEISDYLLAHAHLRLKQMRSRLSQQEETLQERVDAQLKQKVFEQQLVTSERLEEKIQELKSTQEEEKSHFLSEHLEQAEQELQKQLTRQAAAHQQHLQQTLRDQQEHLESRLDCALHEQAISQRAEFTKHVGSSLARVRGIEAALHAHADQEVEVRKAQELWLSCVALNRVVHMGNTDAREDEDTRKPLAAEVSGVLEALSQFSDSERISDLLNSLPQQAVEQGVPTERELKHRFKQVHAVCRRVALLDEGDPRLTRHFLSWLQSLLMFDRVSARSSEELVDPDQMSTFNKLASAKHALSSGDLEQAVRFMTLLDGESGWVAADWLREARLFLEARQTSDALEAQATASALGTLLGRGLPAEHPPPTQPETEPSPPADS